jgi:hypothetical protein
MNRIQQSILATAAIAVMATGVGCCKNKTGSDTTADGYNDPFFRLEEQRLIEHVGRQQAASAARADATLSAAHFHGDKLNSLGEQKLTLMLEDDNTSKPFSVYIDVVEDTNTSGRRSSVEAFLVASGMANDQFKLENGINPNGIGTPAAPLLKNVSKTDSAGASAAGSQ